MYFNELPDTFHCVLCFLLGHFYINVEAFIFVVIVPAARTRAV